MSVTSGAYDELVAYLNDYEQTTNKLSLTDLRLNGSRGISNSSDHNDSTFASASKSAAKSPSRSASRQLPPTGRQQPSTASKRSSFASPKTSQPQENHPSRPSHFATELEFFLQRIMKRKQMRLHQLRTLQQSLFADLEWDLEFNEGVIDAHSLPKEALSEEEYQTMLFGSDLPDDVAADENRRSTNHDEKRTTVDHIVQASAWNEFDEKMDFSRSFLQSKSKLRTITRSIGEVLSQSSASVRTSRPPYDVSKLDLSHYIQQEELREQQERQRRQMRLREPEWRPSVSGNSSTSSTPHRYATSSSTTHDRNGDEDRPRSSASASSSYDPSVPAPRGIHRFPVDVSQSALAPDAASRVESLASSPTSSPGQHRSVTMSLYSVPDSPVAAAIRHQSPSPTHRQEKSESPYRRPAEEPGGRPTSQPTTNDATDFSRPTATSSDGGSRKVVEDELPPLGRKGSGVLSRSHSHDPTDPPTARIASHVDAPLPVKPLGVAATAASAAIDELDPWMLGISAIEARDSDSDYEAVMLFPAMKATRRPSSSSDKPQRSDFDPVDSFLSTNRSSRSQSFDAHPPPPPPPPSSLSTAASTTDVGHVTTGDRPSEAMVDLFALASQDLDALLGLVKDGDDDDLGDDVDHPARHGGPSLVSSLSSPPPMPKTPVGKPPFSPF